jgi:HSP20 family protein
MLMRFDPFRDFDRLTQAVWGPQPWAARPSAMPMDAYRREGEFVVHFDLPGVDPGSIDITVEKNAVTVTAQRNWTQTEGDQIVASERPQGSFTRQLFLGDGLDWDQISAHYDNGVLTLKVPVAEHAKAKKVEIGTGSGSPKEISAVAA